MSKKIIILVVLALVVSLFAGVWVSSDVFAKSSVRGDERSRRLKVARRGLGQVTAIAENQFTAQKLDGQEYTLSVDADTRFLDKEKDEMSFTDLQTGQWVIVLPKGNDQENLVARMVIILPDDFDPSQLTGAAGVVSGVDVAESTFSLHTKKGEDLSFTVDDETRFQGEVESLDDLQADMGAWVRAERQDDDSLLAQVVRAGTPKVKHAGQISEVDTKAGTFTLHTRRGDQVLTFVVDENTRFRSRDGGVESLDDLQADMVGLVVAKEYDDGEMLALVVIAGTGDQLPRFEHRVAGKVVAVSNDAFTIQARDGVEYTIQVTDETQFRSRGDQVAGLADLTEGLAVLVGGKTADDGEYLAQLVLVMKRK